MPITYLDEEEEDFASPLRPTPLTQPKRRKITYFDEEPAERKAGLLPPIEEMFKPKPKPESLWRQAADIPVGLGKGAAQGVRMFTDILGADNPVSQSIRGVEDYLGNLMSAQAKNDQAEIARIMEEAQDKGILDQVLAGVKAFSVAPVDLTVQALGTMAPVIAGGLAANTAKLVATGIRGGVAAARGLTTAQMTATQAGIGAGMGAGVVKGTIYDEVKNELISQGLSEDAAHQQAVKAQEYGGKNLDQILLGAGLGAAAASTGAEKIIGGILTKTGVGASKSRVVNALKTGVTEAFPEAAQGAQEQLAANIALQREGMDVPTTRGVFSSGALEGIAGFGVGAPLGAIQKASVAEDAARKAEEADAPQTAAAIRAAGQKAATTEKDISATEQAIEETEAATRPTVPIREEEPYVQPPKEEFKAAFARMTPESIAETEANFREQLQSEDEETRVFSQNALDALAEFRAEQAKARPLPTDVLPTETPGATYGREADIYDVFADIRRRPMPPSGPAFESAQVIEEAARRADVLRRTPEGRDLLRRELQGEEMVGGVRRATEEALATAPEPAEGDVFAEIRRPSRAEEAAITIEQQLAEDERIRRSQLGAEALREELAQVESLSRVADNTATDEEVVRLARQGLVNIQDGQNVITPRGEEVMQRGGAPLPRLTPEERAAEVAAAPSAIVEQAPPVTEAPAVTPAPVAEIAPVITEKVDDVVGEVERSSEQQSNTVKVFRGVAEAGNIPTGGTFFTDSEKDASAYAQLAALRQEIDRNEELNELVSEIMAEESAEDVTDLSISTIKSIIEGNNIKVGDISEGAVLRGNINLGNVLNLESFGSEIGSLPETWNELNKLGLVPETWESLDEDTQFDLQDKYRGKAFYSLLEGEVNLNDQFEKGIDTVVFTDQNTEGKGTHRTYLTKAAEQFTQEAAPAEAAPVGIAVGNRVKTKTTPQSFVVEEVLPQSAREAELGEQYYSIRNERTGETQTVEANDIKPVKGKGARKLFAGERAEMPQFRRDSLDAARAMAATGKTPEEIRAVTGWFPGKYDKKMRWEIPDQNVQLNKNWKEAKTIGELITHDELFRAYPEIANIKFEFRPGLAAGVTENADLLVLPSGLKGLTVTETTLAGILHEIQHLIQYREGFERGGNEAAIYKKEEAAIQAKKKRLENKREEARLNWEKTKDEKYLKEWQDAIDAVWDVMGEKPPKRPYEEEFAYYKRLAGEIESRDIEARMRLTDEQRAAIEPYSSENISPEEANIMQQDVAPTPVEVISEQEIRVEEKVSPVPEADRYTFEEAGIRAIEFFNGKAPDGLVIVNDSTNPDYKFKAGYDPETGDIIINRAFIRKGESIEDILTHELGHYIYSDPQFQADFQDFLESMPDEARAEIDRIVNEGYNKETNEVQIEEREVMAFTSLIRRTKRGLTAWEKLKDTIKKIINRFLGTNITLSDQGAMAVFNVGYKRFKSGERIIREMKKGTLRTAPEGMTQMDRDYLAAVERGDMETAQRMVDETAKAAGYNIGPVWHGTNSKFNIFDRKKSREGRFGKGFYFSPSESTANAYAEDAVRTLGGEKFVGKYFLKDAFNYKDSIFVATNPQEIKSADPVTYDDAGNVIPLSQRFRATSPDIRRMAPEPTPAPEAVVEETPAERPKRRTKMQNIIDISTGVKRPKTKLTVNEMTALKDQIKLGARKRREDKRTQREFAKDLTQQLREAAIRGKVRPSQLRAITSKALQTQFDNEASILGFVNYANKVIENANYEKDLSDAKSAIKSAKRLAKQKGLAGNIKANLEKLANIDPRQIEPEEMIEVRGETPISVAEFTAVLKEYMKAGGPVTAEEYVLVPDAEIADFLSKIGEQIETNRKATENLGMDGELAAIADKTPEEIDAELARDEERRNRIEQKINGLAEEAQIGLAKYENPNITSEEKIVLDEMKRITLSDISIGERKEFIKVANNILVNNKFLGAQKFASIAKGQIGAVEAAKDAKTVKRNSATLKLYNVFGEDFGNLLNLGTQSFADTFRNLTGTQYLPRLLYQMGFGEIERGQANTNRARREITDGVQQRFKQIEKETGQKIADTQGVYSMGVAGNLIQIHPDETEAEGIQRMRGLIEKDIERKKRSAKTEDRKTALYVEKALNEVYADSIQGILDNLNRLHPANYKALTFLMNEVLPEYKPMLKEHDELFNNQTENYENPYYLPIRYRSIGAEPKKPGELRGRATDSVTAPKQAPNSIKRIKNTVLPEGKQLDYNLTRNVLDSLSTQLEAAYTNPGWQQVYAFLKTPEAVEALGGVENYDFVTKRINGLSDSRERRIYQMDPFNQAADFVANMVRKIGTSIALGGVGQAAKQMPDQVATTIANVNDLSITTPAFTEIKAALPAMRQFSIGERGEIAGGSKWVNQLEGNFTKLQQFMQDGVWPKAMEAFENLNNFWLIPLKVSDTVAASHGWISYYKKYLKDNDIQFTNWDNESDLIAKGDRSRVEAGLYADQMIDIYQGSSDPTKMATFAQRGDSGGGNLLKTMIMPFSSFVIQQRSRILSDLRDISYGDTDEKKVAAKGLAGTLLGIVIFHGVRRYALPFLTGGVAAATYGLLGVDMEEPDEEERLEKERRVFRQFLGEVASNIFVGGYSAYAETRLIDAVNAAAYFYEIQTQSENVLDDKGEIMSWEKYRKERAPMYRYTGPGADSTLGMLEILPSQAQETFDRLRDLADDEIMDSLTEEEQRVLILAALSETLYTMRLNDADVARMVKRMARDVKDQAEARQKAQRQLQRIYGQ